MKKVTFFVLAIFCSLASYGQYPLITQNVQHDIVGVVGELRGGGSRYHYGLDFSAVDGTNVISINAGPLRKLKGAVAVGEFGYVHCLPSTAISAMADGTQIAAGTILGTIYTPKLGDHVHLQEANVNIYGSAATSWETGGIWINPINGLSPFVDNSGPAIDWVRLYRQGTNSNITSALTLYGQIDVYLNGEDDGIDADGSADDDYNLAPSTASFQITDDANTTIYNGPGVDFSNVPPNASASTFFHNLANSGNWIGSLTNHAFTTPYNRYWNSRKTIAGDYDDTADTPENNDLEGKKIKFNVSSCDRFNCTGSVIPSNSSDFYTVDNFLPFINNFHLISDITGPGNTTIFQYNREQSEEGTPINNGRITNVSASFDNSISTSTATSSVFLSEEMKEMEMRWKVDGQNWSIWSDMTVNPLDPLNWTLEINGFADGCVLFNFKGKDKADNDLLNVYQLTNSNDILNSTKIPTRNGATAWNNDPGTAVGEDFFYSCTDCATIIDGFKGEIILSRKASGDCDDITDFTETITVDCDGNIIVALDGLNELDYIVGWLGTDGIYHLGDVEHIGEVGENCYLIESLDGCCNYSGCIIVTDETHIGTNYDLEFGPSYDLDHRMVTITTDNDNLAYPICINFYDDNNNQPCAKRVLPSSSFVATCSEFVVGESYCIVFEDANGCISEYCFTMEGQTCPGDLNVNLENITDVCGIAPGRIDISIDGGNCPDYALEWSTGSSSTSIYGLSEGTYCVTVTGKDNCSDCKTVKCFDVAALACDDCASDIIITGNVTPYSVCRVQYFPWETLRVSAGYLSWTIQGGSGDYTVTACWINPNTGLPQSVPITGRNGITIDPRMWGDYCIKVSDGCGNFTQECFGFWQVVLPEEIPNCKWTKKYFFFAEEEEFDAEAMEKTILESKVMESVYTTPSRYWSAIRDYEDRENITYEVFSNKTKTVQMLIQFKKSDVKTDGKKLVGSDIEHILLEDPVVIDQATTINESLINSKIKAYPNPFETYVDLEISSTKAYTGKLVIHDVLGKQYVESQINIEKGVTNISLNDLGHLPTGILFISVISDDNKISTIRVMKSQF